MRFSQRIWVRTALALGCVLGLLLLVQSAVGYLYLSRRLVRDQLRRETDRQVTQLERTARQRSLQEPAELAELMREILIEPQHGVVWARILDGGGRVLAESGKPAAAPPGAGELRKLFEARDWPGRMLSTPQGKVYVTALPFRAPVRAPDTTGARRGPRILEIALREEIAARSFGRLHVNLLVSAVAALALLTSMLLLARSLRAYVRAEQLEQQLAVARRVQHDLLPPGLSSYPAIECAAACIPAWQVGGDFYDIFPTTGGGIALVVGDVAGKGLGAALVMSLLHGAVRCAEWVGASAHENATRRLNEVLYSSTSPATFASLFWAYYNPPNLCYINAGHLPPMLLKAGGNGRPHSVRLTEGGPVLGLLRQAVFRQGSVLVEPGDLLVLYSDGVLEAANTAQEEFGEDRLYSAISARQDRPCQELCDEIVDRVRAFSHQGIFQDDVTVVVVRALPSGSSGRP